MTSDRITLRMTPPIEGLRAAQGLAAQAPHRLRRFGRAVWHVLESAGHRRAARELRAMAERMQGYRPDVARLLREAAEFDPRG